MTAIVTKGGGTRICAIGIKSSTTFICWILLGRNQTYPALIWSLSKSFCNEITNSAIHYHYTRFVLRIMPYQSVTVILCDSHRLKDGVALHCVVPVQNSTYSTVQHCTVLHCTITLQGDPFPKSKNRWFIEWLCWEYSHIKSIEFLLISFLEVVKTCRCFNENVLLSTEVELNVFISPQNNCALLCSWNFIN